MGLRFFNSIEAYGLGITRAAFLAGRPPWRYIPAYNACLFMSANEEDVRGAIMAGYPAGLVLESVLNDDVEDLELRIAFDFDGVIADHAAERVFAEKGLRAFLESELAQAISLMAPGR
jgi:5'-nucleotidase